MVFEPRFRKGPPPRSFAADAHDCIMVPILTDRPNTSLWRDARAWWRAPLGSFRCSASARLQAVAAWLAMADRRRLADEPQSQEHDIENQP